MRGWLKKKTSGRKLKTDADKIESSKASQKKYRNKKAAEAAALKARNEGLAQQVQITS